MINFPTILLIVSGSVALTASLLYLISHTAKKNISFWQPFFLWSVFSFWIIASFLLWENRESLGTLTAVFTNEKFRVIMGIFAGITTIAASIPYITSIVAGKTKPERATWSIWSVITIMLLISYYYSGGRDAIWLSLGYAITTAATAILSIKYGVGGWTKLDRVIIAGCGLCLLVWWLSGSALIALTVTMAMDLLGAIPTIKKTYFHPEQEDRWAWVIGFTANGLNLMAVEKWDYAHAAYPVYLFLMVGVIMELVIRPIRKKKRVALAKT